MTLKYVTEADVDQGLSILSNEGLTGDKLGTALNTYLTELDFQRARKSGAPLLLKAAEVGGKRLTADTLLGLSLVEPAVLYGDKSTGEMLRSLSSRVRKTINPTQERVVAEAAGGPLLGSGSLSTYASLVGQQIPLIGSLALTSGLSGLAAKGLGATGAGLRAAQIAGGVVPISFAEAGGSLEQSERLGIDDDIAEKVATLAGPLSGAVEEAQFLLMTGPFKGVSKAGQRALQKTIGKSRFANRALKEFGIFRT